jgi:NAD+ synthase (glutamine-hydrolysing)
LYALPIPFDILSWVRQAAVCIPFLKVADPAFNVERTVKLARRASSMRAAIALFPELGISAYSNEDLFHQDALLDATKSALALLLKESQNLSPVLIVGAPLRFEGRLFNCAVVMYRGQVLGVVPKTYLPNYREFYEKRQFSAARDATMREVSLLDQSAPFGNDLLFDSVNVEGFVLHIELCEDVWAPVPPSTHGALAGATILANLSASNITVGKTDYRRLLCASQSAKCIFCISVLGRGFRRVHHRPGMGRVCRDL